jgi:hypothetical protein
MNKIKNKKKTRVNILTISLVVILIVILIIVRNSPSPDTTKEIAECIGKNAILYTQLGCHACETQEKMFGEDYQHLNVVDCFYEREKCSEIEYTPTWIINNEKIIGVQSIEKLQESTGC